MLLFYGYIAYNFRLDKKANFQFDVLCNIFQVNADVPIRGKNIWFWLVCIRYFIKTDYNTLLSDLNSLLTELLTLELNFPNWQLTGSNIADGLYKL